jgi:hypothetical protein
LTGVVTGLAPIASPTFTGTVTAPSFVGALTGNADTATTATFDTNFSPLRGATRGNGTTTSGSNLTVTHGLGGIPGAVVANVRSNTYSTSTNTNIYVGNINATTFTVYANTDGASAVAATFNWIAMR